MGTNLMLRSVDDVRDRCLFFMRQGTPFTPRDLAEDMAELREDPGDRVALDCGLTHTARQRGDECDEKIDDEACVECREHKAGKALDCGIGVRNRREQRPCESGHEDDCAECRAAAAELRVDCGLTANERAGGATCPDDADRCSACLRHSMAADYAVAASAARQETGALREEISRLRDDAQPGDAAELRALLDCGLGDARDFGKRCEQDCRACVAHGLRVALAAYAELTEDHGRILGRAAAVDAQVKAHEAAIAALTAERNLLVAAQGKPRTLRKAPVARPGQLSLLDAMGPPVAAPTEQPGPKARRPRKPRKTAPVAPQ